MEQPMIDVIAQLDEKEREDFTSWFASLSQKERKSAASVLAKTTVERIRTLLSVPEENRISMFLVERDSWEEFGAELLRSTKSAERRLGEFRKKLRKGI